jgi:hypothetical protein
LEVILGEGVIFKQLNRKILESAFQAELTHNPECGK